MNPAALMLAIANIITQPPEIVISIPPMPGVLHAFPMSATDLNGPWFDRTADLIVDTNGDWHLPRTPGATQEFYQIVKGDL